MTLQTFNGFGFQIDQKKHTMNTIIRETKKIMNSEYLKTLITKNGNTQVAERQYIDTFKTILDSLKYTYTEAPSQSSKDFRNINNIGLNIEMKKTDSFNIMCNDTCPNKDIEYIILFTGKEYKRQNKTNIEPQVICINGDSIVKSCPWLDEFKEDLEFVKNKWCRGENKKMLEGFLRTYIRPTYQFDIRTLIVTQ